MGFFQKLKVLDQKSPQNHTAQNSLISEFRENAKIVLKIKNSSLHFESSSESVRFYDYPLNVRTGVTN